MRCLPVTVLLAVALSTTGPSFADDTAAPAAVGSAPYAQMERQFFAAANGLWNATTIEQKRALTAEVAALTPKMLELAIQNPTDPVAFQALVQTCKQAMWLENNTAYAGGPAEAAADRAIALLLRDHLGSEQLGEACNRLGYGFSGACETFLRTALRESPHREVRGVACLRLAQFLHGRAQRLALLESRPDRARRYQQLFGKSYLDRLRRRSKTEAAAEFERLFERAAREYGGLKNPSGGTIGDQARTELYEIRGLAVGKPAPEIEGEDQDGLTLKLSDFRGKVVLLYFWQHT